MLKQNYTYSKFKGISTYLYYLFSQCPDAPDNMYNCRDDASEKAAMKACGELLGDPFSACHDEVSSPTP